MVGVGTNQVQLLLVLIGAGNLHWHVRHVLQIYKIKQGTILAICLLTLNVSPRDQHDNG